MAGVIECLVVNEPAGSFPQGVTPRQVALFDKDGAPIHLGAVPRPEGADPGPAVPDLPTKPTTSQVAAAFNTLLTSLRTAGVIATD